MNGEASRGGGFKSPSYDRENDNGEMTTAGSQNTTVNTSDILERSQDDHMSSGEWTHGGYGNPSVASEAVMEHSGDNTVYSHHPYSPQVNYSSSPKRGGYSGGGVLGGKGKKIKKEEDKAEEEVDFVSAMQLDVHRVPVKTLRKIIPRLRVMCYKMDEATMGKKKFKHLWDEKPDDWPENVPFKDPNNAIKDLSKKPGKEELRPMFDFLRKKAASMGLTPSMIARSLQPSDSSVMATASDQDGGYTMLLSGSKEPLAVTQDSNRRLEQLSTDQLIHILQQQQQKQHQHQQQLQQQMKQQQQLQQLQQLQSLQQRQIKIEPQTPIHHEIYGENTQGRLENGGSQIIGTGHVVVEDTRGGIGHGTLGSRRSLEMPKRVEELHDRVVSKEAEVSQMIKSADGDAELENFMRKVHMEVINRLYEKIKHSETNEDRSCSCLKFLDAGHQFEALLDVMTLFDWFDPQLLRTGCIEILDKFHEDGGMVCSVFGSKGDTVLSKILKDRKHIYSSSHNLDIVDKLIARKKLRLTNELMKDEDLGLKTYTEHMGMFEWKPVGNEISTQHDNDNSLQESIKKREISTLDCLGIEKREVPGPAQSTSVNELDVFSCQIEYDKNGSDVSKTKILPCVDKQANQSVPNQSTVNQPGVESQSVTAYETNNVVTVNYTSTLSHDTITSNQELPSGQHLSSVLNNAQQGFDFSRPSNKYGESVNFTSGNYQEWQGFNEQTTIYREEENIYRANDPSGFNKPAINEIIAQQGHQTHGNHDARQMVSNNTDSSSYATDTTMGYNNTAESYVPFNNPQTSSYACYRTNMAMGQTSSESMMSPPLQSVVMDQPDANQQYLRGSGYGRISTPGTSSELDLQSESGESSKDVVAEQCDDDEMLNDLLAIIGMDQESANMHQMSNSGDVTCEGGSKGENLPRFIENMEVSSDSDESSGQGGRRRGRRRAQSGVHRRDSHRGMEPRR